MNRLALLITILAVAITGCDDSYPGVAAVGDDSSGIGGNAHGRIIFNDAGQAGVLASIGANGQGYQILSCDSCWIAAPPRGGKMILTMITRGVVMIADTSGAGRVTIDDPDLLAIDDSTVGFSRDASMIAYTGKYRSAKSLITLARSNGNVLQQFELLYGGSSLLFKHSPAFSPDGRSLAFFAMPDSQKSLGLLCMLEITTSRIRIIDSNVAAPRPRSFDWSPSGDRIAYLRALPGGSASRIILADPIGSTRAEITSGEFVHGELSWSPDGRRLAVTRTADGGVASDRHDLWLIDRDGGNATKVIGITGSARSPQWSDDGASILFIESHGHSWGELKVFDLQRSMIFKVIDGAFNGYWLR